MFYLLCKVCSSLKDTFPVVSSCEMNLRPSRRKGLGLLVPTGDDDLLALTCDFSSLVALQENGRGMVDPSESITGTEENMTEYKLARAQQ